LDGNFIFFANNFVHLFRPDDCRSDWNTLLAIFLEILICPLKKKGRKMKKDFRLVVAVSMLALIIWAWLDIAQTMFEPSGSTARALFAIKLVAGIVAGAYLAGNALMLAFHFGHWSMERYVIKEAAINQIEKKISKVLGAIFGVFFSIFACSASLTAIACLKTAWCDDHRIDTGEAWCLVIFALLISASVGMANTFFDFGFGEKAASDAAQAVENGG
jgi:hypothetical protein